MLAIDLSKQKELDADPKARQQINFTENVDQVGQKVFHYWRSERNYFRFGNELGKKLGRYYNSILFQYNGVISTLG